MSPDNCRSFPYRDYEFDVGNGFRGSPQEFVGAFGVSFQDPTEPTCYRDDDQQRVLELLPWLKLGGLPKVPKPQPEDAVRDCRPVQAAGESAELAPSIIDLLGVYQPERRRIVFYTAAIAHCAEQIQINESLLTDLVFVHELGHALCHVGYLPGSGAWNGFAEMVPEVLEALAQLFVVICIGRWGDDRAKAAFDELEKHQPSIYAGWQHYSLSAPGDYVDLLRDVRLRNYQSDIARKLGVDIPIDFFWRVESQGMGINMMHKSSLVLGFDGKAACNGRDSRVMLSRLCRIVSSIRNQQLLSSDVSDHWGMVMDGSWEDISLSLDGGHRQWSGWIFCTADSHPIAYSLRNVYNSVVDALQASS